LDDLGEGRSETPAESDQSAGENKDPQDVHKEL
jgi:hypothetical protein